MEDFIWYIIDGLIMYIEYIYIYRYKLEDILEGINIIIFF